MNVLDVFESSRAALDRAKAGEGPTFIEARVYRYRAHGGAGDDSKTGYRDVAEREAWERACPVEGYFGFLNSLRLIDRAQRGAMTGEIEAEIEAAFEHALAAPEPGADELFKHVYAD
jgi:pyruvate dehydrogenase E1 component alpha subunit